MKSISGRTRRVVNVALVGLVALGATVSVTSVANAQSGRRICMYSSEAGFQFKDGSGNVAGNYLWALNYKKDGKCPQNNQASLNDGTGATSSEQEKITCEKFQSLIAASSDPCPSMTVDSVYRITRRTNISVAATFAYYGHY
jgi:hypothetical protein